MDKVKTYPACYNLPFFFLSVIATLLSTPNRLVRKDYILKMEESSFVEGQNERY